jgi:hypothetical protein
MPFDPNFPFDPEDDGFPNDWFVPEADGYPNDWFVPEADGFPNDWFVPDNQNPPAPAAAPPSAPPAPSLQTNATKPVPINGPAARFDPYEAFWSQMPASRVGAMAWHPPIFLSPDSFAPQSSPSWARGGPSPRFSTPLEQFLPPTYVLPGRPPEVCPGGILGGIPKLAAASGVPNPTDAAASGQPGDMSKLTTTPGPTGVPSRKIAPGLLAPLRFSGPPPSDSGIGDQDPRLPLPRYLVDPTQAPLTKSTDASESPIPAKNGILPSNPSATPLATTAGLFAPGGSTPSNPSPVGADSNPFSAFLNALNPISPAFAADDEGFGWPPAIAQALAQGLIDAATAKRLIERGKVLQNAQEAFEDLRDIVQDRASPRALGRALEASGVSRPEGYEAHHIVAGNRRRAADAREILKKFKIRINDASNGVFLPAEETTEPTNGEAIHGTLHTNKYYGAVNDALAKATTREQAIATLQEIGRKLQSGGYP